MIDLDIAASINRSLKSVREMRRRLGLIKLSGRGRVELRQAVAGKSENN